MLVDPATESGRPVLLADVMVVWDASEQMVGARRNVRSLVPFPALEGHVALFLRLLQTIEQDRHAVAGRVLQRERDEDEPDAEQPQLVPRDRVLLVEPL